MTVRGVDDDLDDDDYSGFLTVFIADDRSDPAFHSVLPQYLGVVVVDDEEIELPPTIAVSSVEFLDGTGMHTLPLYALSSGAKQTQEIQITASVDDDELVTDVSVDYTQGSTTGSLNLSLVAQPGRNDAIITLTVMDSGPDYDISTLDDNLSVECTIRVVLVDDITVSLGETAGTSLALQRGDRYTELLAGDEIIGHWDALGMKSLSITGTQNAESLTISGPVSLVVPSGGVTFHGGEQPAGQFDELRFDGLEPEYRFDSPDAGVATVEGREIRFEGVELHPNTMFDFGDLPEVYDSEAGHLPASHAPHAGGPMLGTTADYEPGPRYSATAGDDAMDDGVALPTQLYRSSAVALTASTFVSVNQPAFVDAWIDFNADGDFDDADEQIAASMEAVAGVNLLPFAVPVEAVAGTTFARFRVSSTGGLAPNGMAVDGEVEDYQLRIADADEPGLRVLNVPALDGTYEIVTTGTTIGLHRDGLEIGSLPRVATAELLIRGSQLSDHLEIVSLPRSVSRNVTVKGGAGDDLIGAEQLSINIRVDGGGGHDTLVGGVGRDTLAGGLGNDSLIGNDGNDALLGSQWWDTLDGGAGNDTVKGQASADTLTGGEGDDRLIGNGSYDVVIESGDVDFLVLNKSLQGVGNDRLSKVEEVRLTGGDGSNVMDGSGFDGNLILNGGGGDDSLFGGVGDDSLDAGDGDDFVSAGLGNDEMHGGEGADLLVKYVQGDATLFRASLRIGPSDDFRWGAISGFESVELNGGDDANLVDVSRFTGAVTLRGHGGDDTLIGSNGDDVLYGGSGNDDLNGKEGNDLLNGGDGNDLLNGEYGNDLLNGDNGDDTVSGGHHLDTINGGQGDDSLSGDGEDDLISGGDGQDWLDGGRGDDSVYGEGGDDTFGGEQPASDRDEVYGGDGNDTYAVILSGEFDLKTAGLVRHESNPVQFVARFPDRDIEQAELSGGSRSDWLDAAEFDGPVTLYGNGANDVLVGSNYGSVLIGGAGSDGLEGGDGNDLIDGGDGNDLLMGYAGNDTLLGGSGDDIMDGDNYATTRSTGNDSLDGGEGQDTIWGGPGGDVLNGGDGDDLLIGREGSDSLDGGLGADTLDGGNRGDRSDSGDVFADPTEVDETTNINVNFGDLLFAQAFEILAPFL